MSISKLPRSFYGMDASPRALKIRRRLTKRESLVHEVVIAVCRGRERPTSIAELADRAGLHKGHVSEALASLETLCILRRVWLGAKTSSRPSLTIELLDDLDAIERQLGIREGSDGRRRRATNSGTVHTDQIGNGTPPQSGNSTAPNLGTAHLTGSDQGLDQNKIPPSVPPPRQPEPRNAARTGAREGAMVDEDLVEHVHNAFAALGENGARWRNGLRSKFLPPIVVLDCAPTNEEIIAVVRKRVSEANIRSASCPPALVLAPDDFSREIARLRTARVERAARISAAESTTGDARSAKDALVTTRTRVRDLLETLDRSRVA